MEHNLELITRAKSPSAFILGLPYQSWPLKETYFWLPLPSRWSLDGFGSSTYGTACCLVIAALKHSMSACCAILSLPLFLPQISSASRDASTHNHRGASSLGRRGNTDLGVSLLYSVLVGSLGLSFVICKMNVIAYLTEYLY